MENKDISQVSTNVVPGFGTAEQFALLQRVGRMFAYSNVVPDIFRGEEHIGDCSIAVLTANNMGMNPFMLMNNMHIIHGKPGFSSQFLIATFNASGRYSSIKYKMTGKKGTPTFGCIAYTTELATGDVIEGPEITMKMADDEGWINKNGSKWRTMPEQMLRYRAAAFLIRTTAPEISLGFQTKDELEDIGTNAEQDAREEIRVNANSEVFEPKAIAHDETPKASIPTKQTAIEAKAEPVKKSAPKQTEQAALEMEGPGY